MSKAFLFLMTIGCATVFSSPAAAQDADGRHLLRDMAEKVLLAWPDSMPGRPLKWTYEEAVVMQGMERAWRATGDGRYFRWIERHMGFFLNEAGTIHGYKQADFNLDNILGGRTLIMLYRVTAQKKYLLAAERLNAQLASQPRNDEKGFWHKQVYPAQMWLDGAYMASPFMAEYADFSADKKEFGEAARQLLLMEKRLRNPATGLLFHGYDASRKEMWADRATGRSSQFWARAMGWYGMALVDVLDAAPPAGYADTITLLKSVLRNYAGAVARFQDAGTGLWWDVLDKANALNNYPEASASCMFVYVLAKSARMGWLSSSFLANARRGYNGIVKTFVKESPRGPVLDGTVTVSGLGGKPYRDGSYAYYTGEKTAADDPKGIGAFLLAASEMEAPSAVSKPSGKSVLLDNFFNHELRKDAEGNPEPFHYLWNEMDNNGYSLFGDVFRSFGAQTGTLGVAPDAHSLATASVYIITDPDTDKETASPNYVQEAHIRAITAWVRAGGTLILFGNDSGNAEFRHFNKLLSAFGASLKEDSHNRVTGSRFEMGSVPIAPANPVFTYARNAYIKEFASLSPGGVKPLVTKDSAVVCGTLTYGKGRVFIAGDPWFYNEYLDGRKLPAAFDNFQAARDLAGWALQGPVMSKREIVVAQNGQGDFRSIGDALAGIPPGSSYPVHILVRPGIYREKLNITRDDITIEGSDMDKVIIVQSIARDEFRCDHADDWGVATVNIGSSDITLRNLTVTNDYQAGHPREHFTSCPSDTARWRVVTPAGHQMALRTMNGTRIRALHCHFISKAGDTVSPWNTLDGMFYFSDCIMEGGVDFYCPRGWAYAEHCRFLSVAGSAAIWHDGSGNPDQKTVLVDCSFEGFPGFLLGRYHKDAQFYLVGCRFSSDMADRPIYHVSSVPPVPHGERVYYLDCHRAGGNDFAWYRDNFAGTASSYNTQWLFGKRWNPKMK